jgi:hypothetical protein
MMPPQIKLLELEESSTRYPTLSTLQPSLKEAWHPGRRRRREEEEEEEEEERHYLRSKTQKGGWKPEDD